MLCASEAATDALLLADAEAFASSDALLAFSLFSTSSWEAFSEAAVEAATDSSADLDMLAEASTTDWLADLDASASSADMDAESSTDAWADSDKLTDVDAAETLSAISWSDALADASVDKAVDSAADTDMESSMDASSSSASSSRGSTISSPSENSFSAAYTTLASVMTEAPPIAVPATRTPFNTLLTLFLCISPLLLRTNPYALSGPHCCCYVRFKPARQARRHVPVRKHLTAQIGDTFPIFHNYCNKEGIPQTASFHFDFYLFDNSVEKEKKAREKKKHMAARAGSHMHKKIL